MKVQLHHKGRKAIDSQQFRFIRSKLRSTKSAIHSIETLLDTIAKTDGRKGGKEVVPIAKKIQGKYHLYKLVISPTGEEYEYHGKECWCKNRGPLK